MNWIYAVLAILVICVLIAGGVWWSTHNAQKVATHEQTVAGLAVVGEHQAQAQTAAQQIVVSGGARDHLDIQVHQDNAKAIQAAPGASEKLDPAFVSTFNGGLCRYASDASDPGCSGLRGGNSSVVPTANR